MYCFLLLTIEQSEIINIRSSHRSCSVKKGVLRNFAKFTVKHLCQSFFFKELFHKALKDKNTSVKCVILTVSLMDIFKNVISYET